MKLRERTLWVLAGLWAGAIWLVSGIPRTDDMRIPLPSGGVDKPLHLLAYLLLGALVGLALRARGWRSLSVALLSLASAAAYGSLDEWHQSWVPGRVASWQDWVADVLGAALGAGLAAFRPAADAGRTGDESGETADSADQ